MVLVRVLRKRAMTIQLATVAMRGQPTKKSKSGIRPSPGCLLRDIIQKRRVAGRVHARKAAKKLWLIRFMGNWLESLSSWKGLGGKGKEWS